MYISKKASRARQREAQRARDNRAEIVKALLDRPDHRRDLFKWGIFTASGLLALQERPQPVRAQRLRRRPDRHAAQPAVRRRTSSPSRCRGLQLQTPMPLTRIADGQRGVSGGAR